MKSGTLAWQTAKEMRQRTPSTFLHTYLIPKTWVDTPQNAGEGRQDNVPTFTYTTCPYRDMMDVSSSNPSPSLPLCLVPSSSPYHFHPVLQTVEASDCRCNAVAGLRLALLLLLLFGTLCLSRYLSFFAAAVSGSGPRVHPSHKVGKMRDREG